MDDRTIEDYQAAWREIKLRIRFERDWLNQSRTGSYSTSHLQIESETGEALPITATGYRSHFIFAEEIDRAGVPVAFALDWLDHASMKKTWKQRPRFTQQSLF